MSNSGSIMRFAAPGFSSKSTKTEKAIFNPGGIGTGDDITETGHKTWFSAEQEEAAPGAAVAAPKPSESFDTRSQRRRTRSANGVSYNGGQVTQLSASKGMLS